MGGFLGLGNSSAKTDRGNQLAGINADWNVYNRGLPFAETEQAKGTTTTQTALNGLDAAKQYWQRIMSGDKSAVMQAAAPAINTINTQADAARKQQAEMGTSRGGGTIEANQEAESKRLGQIGNIVAAQQPQAAAGVSDISTTEANIGQAELSKALQALGLSGDVAQEIINSSIQSRPISIKANQAVVQQWSNMLAALGL